MTKDRLDYLKLKNLQKSERDMPLNVDQKRRYRRVDLDAMVLVRTSEDVAINCQCVHFSEDGIDLKPTTNAERFPSHLFKAGGKVSLQILNLDDAPVLQAIVVKHAPFQIGLKFIKD